MGRYFHKGKSWLGSPPRITLGMQSIADQWRLVTHTCAQWSCTEIGHHIMMIYLNPLSKDCFSWELNNRKGDLTFWESDKSKIH